MPGAPGIADGRAGGQSPQAAPSPQPAAVVA
jgi:hypothetical protein